MDLPHVDFLKVDTQGAELMVLQNAVEMLARAAVIQCKVEFSPIYASRPLFHDVARLLSDHHFYLADFVALKRCHYGEDAHRPPGEGHLLWADAVFFRDVIDHETLAVQTLIAATVYKKLSLANYLLHKWKRTKQKIAQLCLTSFCSSTIQPRRIPTNHPPLRETNVMAQTPPAPVDPQSLRWFHSFDLGNDEQITGVKDLKTLQKEADLIFEADCGGLSVLDIGAWDGFFSFEAERRGASRVVATDHFCWSGPGWGTRAGFDYMHHRLGSSVEAVDADLADPLLRNLGQFDLVLFLGVFYHLKDPYIGLETAASLARRQIVIETVTALPHEKLPAMRFFKSGELGGDPTNFWAPNLPALRMMLEAFGFSRIEFTPSPASLHHPLGASRFRQPAPHSVHRTIIHAWR